MDIIVDPRFRDKIPRPSEEERRRLEENILKDGLVRDPLVLWKGTNILVDGHNRWDIIQKHPEIPYTTIEQEFENEWDVVAWICRNQLGRRNISKVVYDKLIQEEYEAVQRIPGGDHKSEEFKNQSGETPHLDDKTPKTRKIIAEEHGITEQAVRSAVEFGRGLDAADAVAPGFKDEILSGDISAKKQEIAEMRKMKPEQIAEKVEEIRNPAPKVKFPSNRGGSRTRKATDEELAIEEADKRTTDKSAVVEYGIDDLLEELRNMHDEFFDKYLFALDIHRDIATDHKGKTLACLKEFETKWKKEVKEIFK